MAGKPANMHFINNGLGKGRFERTSPSQSYAAVSTTTLFMATAVLSPGWQAASRQYWEGQRLLCRKDQAGPSAGQNGGLARGANGPAVPGRHRSVRKQGPEQIHASSGDVRLHLAVKGNYPGRFRLDPHNQRAAAQWLMHSSKRPKNSPHLDPELRQAGNLFLISSSVTISCSCRKPAFFISKREYYGEVQQQSDRFLQETTRRASGEPTPGTAIFLCFAQSLLFFALPRFLA